MVKPATTNRAHELQTRCPTQPESSVGHQEVVPSFMLLVVRSALPNQPPAPATAVVAPIADTFCMGSPRKFLPMGNIQGCPFPRGGTQTPQTLPPHKQEESKCALPSWSL